jgi:hypothetical protein
MMLPGKIATASDTPVDKRIGGHNHPDAGFGVLLFALLAS